MDSESAPSLATILFTDLVGSTATRVRLGEERADELRGVHDRLVTRCIEVRGGRVVRSTGDGLVAAFASASEALSAAVHAQQTLERYGRSFDAIAPLPVRMGLSVGDVSWESGDCFGTPLAEAARLEAEATGGQILCSQFVREMAKGRGEHTFRDIGFLELKGLRDPLAACEVVWSPLGGAAIFPFPPELVAEAARPFVSRTAELELAESLLADPARERLAVLWLLGEPGIGKTRLAVEIARRAHAAGALVLGGHCDEDLPVPYQPFIEALRWFAAQLPDDGLAERLGDSPGELTRLVPGLRARLPGLEASESTSSELDQHRLFEAVRTWLAAAGGDRPVVMVVDDIHWAAGPTISLLGHVARSADPSRAVLICTARTTSPDDNDAIATLAEELDRRRIPSHRLELAGLAVEEVGELVEKAAGRPLDDRLLTLAAHLHRETAGNPLFVDALLGSLPPDAAWQPTPLPRSLNEMVGRRISRLPPEVQELLQTAATAGLHFDLRVVARASDRDEAAALEALETAARARLVEESGPNRFSFAHALVRATLREQLSQTRLARLHLRIGDALESVHSRHLDELAAELAHHFSKAVPAGGAARAYRYSLLAAERASHLLAHEEAARAYGRTLELLDEIDNPDPIARCKLLLAQGEAQDRASDFEAAIVTLWMAAAEATARDAPEHLARAAIAWEGISYTRGHTSAEEVRVLERAVAGLTPEGTPLQAIALAALGRALELAGRRVEAVDYREEALTVARRLQDPVTTTRVLSRTLFAHQSIEHAPEMAACCAELMDVARLVGDDDSYLFGSYFAMFAAAQLGELERYEQLLVVNSCLTEQLRQPFWQQSVIGFRYFLTFLAGDLPGAENLLEEWYEIPQTRLVGAEGAYGVNKFLLHRERGRLAEIAPALRTLVSRSPEAGLWRPGLVALYADLDLLDEARHEFECLAAEDFAAVPDDGNRGLCLALLVEPCCALGDSRRASWLLEALRLCEARLLLFHGNVACLGPADRLLGMLAATAGYPEEAERLFNHSLEFSRRLNSPLWVAHCLFDYAMHLQPREPARAQAMLTEAAELCERQALIGLGQRIKGLVPLDDRSFD
jgi:class 3 adenylate cyclase